MGSRQNHQKINKQQNELFKSVIMKLSVGEFIARLKEVYKAKRIKIRGDKIGGILVPNWIDQIIYRLLMKHSFTEKETLALIDEFEMFGYENIPTLHIRSSLMANLSILSKKESKNDMIDIMRISTGVPIADIFLTDKQRCYEIKELKLDTSYNTKVFSGTSTDLLSFLDEIKLIFNQ